jgi:L-asparaginase
MKKILLIYTGGTIGMMKDPESGTLRSFNFEELSKQAPELKRFAYTLDVHSFNPIIDSSNMQPEVWVRIAELIGKSYDGYDGFVILHGSDTMAYTASALSFMLEGLGKPVVLTGSQLPVGEIRTDARENLVTAIEIAASDKPLVPEVCIYFDYKLYRGNRASKYNSVKFEAFQSVNYPALAEAGVHIRYNTQAIMTVGENTLKVHTKLDTSVGLLKLFPGISEAFVKAVLQTPGMKALVLEAFGSGNAPTDSWFIDALKSAAEKGIIIFDVTQCGGGTVELGLYETSATLRKIGVIGGSDITTESAIAKLMYLLGKGLPKNEIETLLQQSLRGEMMA